MIVSEYKPKYSYREAREKLDEAISIIQEVLGMYGCRAGNAIQDIHKFCVWLHTQEWHGSDESNTETEDVNY